MQRLIRMMPVFMGRRVTGAPQESKLERKKGDPTGSPNRFGGDEKD